MELQEALTFWASTAVDSGAEDQPIAIDAESIPGWVIALRRPRDRAPYVEIWSAKDFITETQIHQRTRTQRSF